jgi:hypothetical protein
LRCVITRQKRHFWPFCRPNDWLQRAISRYVRYLTTKPHSVATYTHHFFVLGNRTRTEFCDRHLQIHSPKVGPVLGIACRLCYNTVLEELGSRLPSHWLVCNEKCMGKFWKFGRGKADLIFARISHGDMECTSQTARYSHVWSITLIVHNK